MQIHHQATVARAENSQNLKKKWKLEVISIFLKYMSQHESIEPNLKSLFSLKSIIGTPNFLCPNI